MDVKGLKQKVCDAIDDRRDEVVEIGRTVWAMPELGFKEIATAAFVADQFAALGLDCEAGLAVTGVRADVAGGSPGPTIAILGEMDALLTPGHPEANPATGAAHNCGHHAQVAAMLGAGMGLIGCGAMTELAGTVALFAVPAEEYVEIEHRQRLRDAGEIEFLGGKAELVRVGAFDDVDAAMLVHAMGGAPGAAFSLGATMNGFQAKTVRFAGRAAHAGARPDQGVNALNAAALAIMGINAQRETFREEDAIRVHFIMTKGGDLVNIVPDDVRLEMFVRGRTLAAIDDAAAKVDRALRGGAGMVGAQAEIETLPGYLPLFQEPLMGAAFRRNAEALVGADGVREAGHVAACTDMGDLAHLMPVIQPSGGGFAGMNHTVDFTVADEEAAYVLPAKALAMTVVDLLADDAALARRVLAGFEPVLTKDEYLDYLRGGGTR